jgi:hypothetical protein
MLKVMTELELFTLDLHSSIAYVGMENPPIVGAPLTGAALLPADSGGFREVGLGSDMEEGEEELFVFDAEELVAFDPDEGPSLRLPLPRPRYYGRRPAKRPGEASGEKKPERAPSETVLATGSYSFVQWRPRDEEELAAGLEWFAREVWWERVEASGPYILRRVREDGKLATQALRRLSS